MRWRCCQNGLIVEGFCSILPWPKGWDHCATLWCWLKFLLQECNVILFFWELYKQKRRFHSSVSYQHVFLKSPCQKQTRQHEPHHASWTNFPRSSIENMSDFWWQMTDLYELLGLSPSRSLGPADIRSAYRRSALQAHPDKGGSEETLWWVGFNRIVFKYPRKIGSEDDLFRIFSLMVQPGRWQLLVSA